MFTQAQKSSQSKEPLTAGFIAALLPIALISLYSLLFYNKYFPLSEGWFSAYLKLMEEGLKPYKDFYYFLPPLYLQMIHVFQAVFGDGFFALRLLGVVVIALITHISYLFYRLIFPIYVAVITATFSIIFYLSNVTYIGYDFFHFMTLFALYSGYLLCVYIKNNSNNELAVSTIWQKFSLLLSGFFGANAFLIKQSNGFVVIFISLIALAIYEISKRNIWSGFKACSIFFLGVFVPFFITVATLSHQHLLTDFIQQALLGGSQSKGSFFAIAFGWIPRLISLKKIFALSVYLLCMAIIGYKFRLKANYLTYVNNAHIFSQLLIVAVLWLLAIYLPYFNIGFSYKIIQFSPLVLVFHSLVFVSFFGAVVIGVVALCKILLQQNNKYATIYMLSAVSLGLALATGTSAGIAEGGVFLATGLVLGQCIMMQSWKSLGAFFTIAAAVILSAFMVSLKYTLPYTWWFLSQPDVRYVSTTPSLPQLSGMKLMKNDAQVIENIYQVINKNTTSQDCIVTFPNVPLFYFLNDRKPCTYAVVHWFDVTPDDVAISDAKIILQHQPKVLLLLEPPQAVWRAHEKGFRMGEPSGQRQILNAIDELTYYPNSYHLMQSTVMSDGYQLRLWIKH